MGETPDEIRTDIEMTRASMTETVEALGYKADVPTRVKDTVAEKKDAVVDAVASVGDRIGESMSGVTGSAGEALPDRAQLRRGMRTAAENPLGLALGGAALGFVAGLALPSTRTEQERVGPLADELRQQAREVAGETLDRGRAVASEAGHAALDTMKERGAEEGQHLQEDLRTRVQEVGSSTTD